MHRLFILSDGTGRTAQQALKAALTQFPEVETEITIFSNVRDESQVISAIEEAANVHAFVVHTIVSQHLRDRILDLGKLHGVETIDLMGPLLGQLENKFANYPSQKPGLFYHLNKAYFQRIEAMEFALRHDDGQWTEELNKAEIVLLGVSRTFKTPVSIYLAFRGWLAANIPVIPEMELPEIINEIDPGRVFCLTTNAISLAALRKVRHSHLGGATGVYADQKFIQKELQFAIGKYHQNPGWTIIDVTHKPIEEIASEILSRMKEKYGSQDI